MAEMIVDLEPIINTIDIANLVTEDDTPLDKIFSAKQQRLLVEPLYSSWKTERTFLVDAHVGLFNGLYQPPTVPDVFLSLDVQAAEDWMAKERRSYFFWEFGKPPEVVIEVVSNKTGQEANKKLMQYAKLGVSYYVIYDPQRFIQKTVLSIYELHIGKYVLRSNRKLEDIGLGLTLWDGIFESKQSQWLRWCDLNGKIIPTGAEQAREERKKVERLAAKLKTLGFDPDEI